MLMVIVIYTSIWDVLVFVYFKLLCEDDKTTTLVNAVSRLQWQCTMRVSHTCVWVEVVYSVPLYVLCMREYIFWKKQLWSSMYWWRIISIFVSWNGLPLLFLFWFWLIFPRIFLIRYGKKLLFRNGSFHSFISISWQVKVIEWRMKHILLLLLYAWYSKYVRRT